MAVKAKERVLWDACVFIDFLQKERDRYKHIKPIVDFAYADKLIIVASTMAIVETTKIKGKSKKDYTKLIEDFFDNDFMDIRKNSEESPVNQKGSQYSIRRRNTHCHRIDSRSDRHAD